MPTKSTSLKQLRNTLHAEARGRWALWLLLVTGCGRTPLDNLGGATSEGAASGQGGQGNAAGTAGTEGLGGSGGTEVLGSGPSFVSVSAARELACGVRTDDTVACWGDNSKG